MSSCFKLFLLLGLCLSAWQLDNGLGTRPPIGWSSRAIMKKPGLAEIDLKAQAESLVHTQLLSKGYTYLLLENWVDEEGSLEERKLKPLELFSKSSLQSLSNHIHELRLNLGISLGRNYHRCATSSKASDFTDELDDVIRINEWDVDLVYLENCYSDELEARKRLIGFSDTVNKTGKPMFIINALPPDEIKMMSNPAANAIKVSNFDLGTWESFCQVLDDQVGWKKFTNKRPWPYLGTLNLTEGDNSAFSQSECKFSFLSLIKSPIFFANDLNNMSTKTYELLANEDILRVSQDESGSVGQRVASQIKNEFSEVWAVDLSGGRVAVLLINKSAKTSSAHFEFNDVRFRGSESNVYDLLRRRSMGVYRNSFKVAGIEPNSCMYVRLDPAV